MLARGKYPEIKAVIVVLQSMEHFVTCNESVFYSRLKSLVVERKGSSYWEGNRGESTTWIVPEDVVYFATCNNKAKKKKFLRCQDSFNNSHGTTGSGYILRRAIEIERSSSHRTSPVSQPHIVMSSDAGQ